VHALELIDMATSAPGENDSGAISISVEFTFVSSFYSDDYLEWSLILVAIAVAWRCCSQTSANIMSRFPHS